jgi:hypothetical protein
MNPESRGLGVLERLDSGFRLRRPRNDEPGVHLIQFYRKPL